MDDSSYVGKLTPKATFSIEPKVKLGHILGLKRVGLVIEIVPEFRQQ